MNPSTVRSFFGSIRSLCHRVIRKTVTCAMLIGLGAVPAGFVSWWRAETSTTDLVGITDGALVNGTTFAMGKVGGALVFDGPDDYVALGNAPSMSQETLPSRSGQHRYHPLIPSATSVRLFERTTRGTDPDHGPPFTSAQC